MLLTDLLLAKPSRRWSCGVQWEVPSGQGLRYKVPMAGGDPAGPSQAEKGNWCQCAEGEGEQWQASQAWLATRKDWVLLWVWLRMVDLALCVGVRWRWQLSAGDLQVRQVLSGGSQPGGPGGL